MTNRGEHPFMTLKHLWGFTKVHYRGLAKNAYRAFAMLALIYLTKWGITSHGTGMSNVRILQGYSLLSTSEQTSY